MARLDPLRAFTRLVSHPLWMMRDGTPALIGGQRRFEPLDRMSPDELRNRQLEATRSIVVHAGRTVPFYRDLFRELVLEPEAFDPIDDFCRLPLLTKAIVRNEGARLHAENLDPATTLEASTGGSTGVSMRFLRDRRTVELRRAQELYFDRWLDFSIGDRMALFVAASHHESSPQRLKSRIRNATCERMISFDPARHDPEYLRAFADRFRRHRPTYAKCFPNSLAVFAMFVESEGIELPAVRAVSCAGETLYPRQRELFERVLGGPVFEKYGTREHGVIACECRMHHGLHLFTEGALVELMDDEGQAVGPGEVGRVVVTDLFNRAMPLIRYEIGDLAERASRERCPCGSPLPLLGRLLGRDRDIVVDRAGRPRVGYLFVETLKDLDLELQFQVEQTVPGELTVRWAGGPLAQDARGSIALRFGEILGPDSMIRFEQVESIERDPSGKYRYVKSACTPWGA